MTTAAAPTCKPRARAVGARTQKTRVKAASLLADIHSPVGARPECDREAAKIAKRTRWKGRAGWPALPPESILFIPLCEPSRTSRLRGRIGASRIHASPAGVSESVGRMTDDSVLDNPIWF